MSGTPPKCFTKLKRTPRKPAWCRSSNNFVRERIVGVGYASIAAPALCDGVDDDGIVSSVTARIHEHGTLQAQGRLQLLEPGERRIRRRIGAIRRVRISVTRAKYVAMGVAASRRRAVLRTAGVGIWWLAGGNIRHVCYRSDGPTGIQSGPTDDRTDGHESYGIYPPDQWQVRPRATSRSRLSTRQRARCLRVAPAANRQQLDAAVTAARVAVPLWRSKSFAERAAFIGKLAAVCVSTRKRWRNCSPREQGKPIGQARDEIARAATQSEGMAAIRIEVEKLADDGQRRIELHYRPLGVVGIITPWNAPINLAAGPITAALYTGNTRC